MRQCIACGVINYNEYNDSSVSGYKNNSIMNMVKRQK